MDGRRPHGPDPLRRLHDAADAMHRHATPPAVAALRARVRRRRVRRTWLTVATTLVAGVAGWQLLQPGADSGPAVSGTVAAPPAPAPPPDTGRPSAAPRPSSPAPSAPDRRSPEAEQPPAGPGPAPSTAPARRTVTVYVLRPRPGERCPGTVAVRRTVDAASPALGALRALLDGTTPAEERRGLSSAFDGDAWRLTRLRLEGTTAHVDFRSMTGVLPARDSCEVTKIMTPIRRTLQGFPWIDDVRVSLRGSERAFRRDVLHIDEGK
ncbi:GerMN domain-containing protein [Streptomyces sp. F63]|uniref:GerMN domain-containing protein n=1 Tax=Streptomyces sp. F63 TaxID=2824887 RepID=UPI001B389F77|nr:GerMN domain-containing protein [Streptomyces sp. F63]MBQ0988032.1 GerMN domain-containing protein [Streptomyces sp. F63]